MERQRTESLLSDGGDTTDSTSGMCENYPVLRDLLSPKEVVKPEVSSQVGLIRQLVEGGVPVDFSIEGWTFLHTVCLLGNVELLKFLLHRLKEKDGELCKLLLDHGAVVNARYERNGNTPLHCACVNQSEFTKEIFKLLLDHGADANARDELGDTPLHHACVNQSEFTKEICKLLLDHGAVVNARYGRNDNTPLHCACVNQSEFTKEICKLLLDRRADANARDELGDTPLHHACVNQSEFTKEICKLLLYRGADANAREEYDNTPLHRACVNQSEFTKEICKLLLYYKADINARDEYDNTPLHRACVNQSEFTKEICELLLDRRADVNASNQHGVTPLHHACVSQSEFTKEICELLLDNRKADVNASNQHGVTPLHHAGVSQSEFTKEICELLLDRGADVNAKDKYEYEYNNTSLHRACVNQSEFTKEICKLLLDHGVDANARDEYKYDNTPLHHACVNQSEFTKEICKLLLDGKADANASNQYGNTPLHCACKKQFESTKEIFKLLLDHGADINSRNREDKTPIFCCVEGGLSTLKDSRSQTQETDVEQNLRTQVSGHNFKTVDMCEWLIESGADVNIRMCENSLTVYHCIVKFYLSSILDIAVRKLISEEQLQVSSLADEIITFFTNNRKGRVTINSRDEEGNTSLHAASKAATWDQVQKLDIQQRQRYNMLTLSLLDCLISCGSKVNAVNDKQQTPLHLASIGPVIKTLLRSGAEPNVRDENRNTPLMMWASVGDDTQLESLCFSPADMEEYFEQGMDAFVVNIKGDTVLDVLLSGEKFFCAKNFITAVVAKDSNNAVRKDGNGETFLHVLCKCDDDRVQELIELILKLGADPNCFNQKKETPLHVLCRKLVAMFSEEEQTVEDPMTTVSAWAIGDLKKYGADPEILDGNEKTCLDITKDNNLSDLQELLEIPVELIEIPPLLPWEQNSVKHRSLLGQVARHQKCKQIEMFHYHCQPIGSGAFGHVHVGINEKDGREIAIKRIELLRLHRPEDKREIKNLLCLRDCEQIVKYHSYYRDEHFLYIILELMDGSLDELICQEPNHVELCRDVLTGLAYLHDKEVLHRDIKPGNILYKTRPRLCLKLADFGLSAKASFRATMATCSVMHSKAGTRCWMAAEIHETTEHFKASDVFAAGLVLHHILAEKKHAFGPKDETGMNDAKIQNETEANIMSGHLNLSDSISPEACHLMKLMLQHNKDDRPMAAVCLNHPLFWSKAKKTELLRAVGNQPEFQEPRHVASARAGGLSPVETDLEAALGPEFVSNPWKGKIPQIYKEMVLAPRSRRYDTTSAVDLVRFVRNSYAHVSDATRSTGFQVELLNKFVYLDKFPTLFITVYQAVMKYVWNGREEIKCVI